jgi:hypothetical protein
VNEKTLKKVEGFENWAIKSITVGVISPGLVKSTLFNGPN